MRQRHDAAAIAAVPAVIAAKFLFQRIVDRCEFGVELRADALDRGDDRKRDAGSDQAIFDRGCTGLIVQESQNQPPHPKLLLPHMRILPRPSQEAKLSLIGCEGVDEQAENSIKAITGFWRQPGIPQHFLDTAYVRQMPPGGVFAAKACPAAGRPSAARNAKRDTRTSLKEAARALYRTMNSCSNYRLQAGRNIGQIGERSA